LRSIITLPVIMRMPRCWACVNSVSAEPRCTVLHTMALVVPLRSSSSRKNDATPAAYCSLSKRRSSGKVYVSSQCSRPGDGDAMMSVCGKWMCVSMKPGTISLPL
jgi:hypothetical protein